MKIIRKLLCLILGLSLSFPSLASIQVINKHQNTKLTFSNNDIFTGVLSIVNYEQDANYVYFDVYNNRLFISSDVSFHRYDDYKNDSGHLHREFAVSPMVYCAYYNGYDIEYDYVSKTDFARVINDNDYYLNVCIKDDVVYFMYLSS